MKGLANFLKVIMKVHILIKVLWGSLGLKCVQLLLTAKNYNHFFRWQFRQFSFEFPPPAKINPISSITSLAITLRKMLSRHRNHNISIFNSFHTHTESDHYRSLCVENRKFHLGEPLLHRFLSDHIHRPSTPGFLRS